MRASLQPVYLHVVRFCRIIWCSALGVAFATLACLRLAYAGPEAVTLSPAVVCNGCHGPYGNSAGVAVPSLAGQPEAYFMAAMAAYRAGKRGATVMGGIAKGYSDAELKSMANYYARQRPQSQEEALDPRLVKAGSKVFYKRCNTCHLDGKLWSAIHANRAREAQCSGQCHLDYGAEKGASVPVIGGQGSAYLETELHDFLSGVRTMSPRKAKALKGMSRDDISAVAAFYASQSPTSP